MLIVIFRDVMLKVLGIHQYLVWQDNITVLISLALPDGKVFLYWPPAADFKVFSHNISIFVKWTYPSFILE